MKIIVGLGNPGDKYKHTRHNIGFVMVDELAKKANLKWELSKKFKAEIAKEGDMILIKPQTFMNESGAAVKTLMNYYKLLPKKIGIFAKKEQDLSKYLTVIHDDLDIELGKFKISSDSRSAGHKGVQSIIDSLKTKNFRRFRIGIKPGIDNRVPTEKYVLEKFKHEEQSVVDRLVSDLVSRLIN